MSEVIFNQNEELSEEFVKLIENLREIKIDDDSVKVQKKLVQTLNKMGFEVKCNFPANERGDGRKGKIHLIAYGLDKPVGICIDNKSYRKSSIIKLNSIPDIYRMLIVRNGSVKPLKDSICVGLSLDIKESKKRKGIYTIINKMNKKVYIGSSIDLDKRFSTHKNQLNNNFHYNVGLQNDWNKFGEENFRFEIVKLIDSDVELPKEEKLLIDKTKEVTCVYNVSDPLEEAHRNRFEKGRKKTKGFHKYSKQQIIHCLNDNFADKIKILHEHISERKFYSKEKLDEWFMDNITDENVLKDYRLKDFLKAWYNKNGFSVLEVRKWKSTFEKLYKISIKDYEYILVTPKTSSELYESKYKVRAIY